MNLKNIIKFFPFFLFLSSCANYNYDQTYKKEKLYYSSTGFALIYEQSLYTDKIINKKINNEEIYVVHNFLNTNTRIQISNPDNSKFILTKVNRKSEYPKIFNILITKKIAEILDLDETNPFVEVNEVKKNKTFVAKKSNTYDEEKNVADTAPVDEVTMQNLNTENSQVKKKDQKKYNYFLIIGDFYYHESALKLKDELLNKVKTNKFFIKKISKNSHRLGLGPFKNFKALKSTYISLNNLGFDNLDIYKE
tara:strand:+ start:997 stop:1749 length:753 start_codon:yes stop_codon:yes gene_type:complete